MIETRNIEAIATVPGINAIRKGAQSRTPQTHIGLLSAGASARTQGIRAALAG